MLVMQQPVLRRFWYPVMPAAHLAEGPKPFRLLGQDLVLWLAEGEAVALEDRCCHRTAKLSRGMCERGRLVCGYHGWEYDPAGMVVRVPQGGGGEDRPTRMGVKRFHAALRYGYVWVALEEPLYALPDFEEADQPGFRQIDQFYEVWECAGLRLMENSFDNAHIAFVHRASFGDQARPEPAGLDLTVLADGFVTNTSVPVVNSELQKANLRINSDETVRHMQGRWYMPFVRKLRITYPNGLVHSIVTAAAPIDDRSSQIVQFCFRSDTEADAPAADIIKFDRQVTNEDRYILESSEFDVPLDQTGAEFSMGSDRPGIMMRRMLRELLATHNETESRLNAEPALAEVARLAMSA